jgi:hypothetical protein
MTKEALVLRRKVLGDTHPDVTETVRGLAWTLIQSGKDGEAETFLREQLARIQGKTLEDDGEEAVLLATLGRCQFDLHRPEEAESLLVRSVPRVVASKWVRPAVKVSIVNAAIVVFERSGDLQRVADYRTMLESLQTREASP